MFMKVHPVYGVYNWKQKKWYNHTIRYKYYANIIQSVIVCMPSEQGKGETNYNWMCVYLLKDLLINSETMKRSLSPFLHVIFFIAAFNLHIFWNSFGSLLELQHLSTYALWHIVSDIYSGIIGCFSSFNITPLFGSYFSTIETLLGLI